MKHLLEIFEASKPKGLIVADIDDTLCSANTDYVKVYKHPGGDMSKEIALTPAEFAIDPDAEEHRDWFDIRDFRDPFRVYQSIVQGKPIIKNLKIIDYYINQGYEFCFLTARSCEDTVKLALSEFLLYRDKKGELKKLGDIFKKTLSAAVNDSAKNYKGYSDAEKKGNVLRDLCKKYDKVVFIDDDPKNVSNAKKLGIENLTVIKAHKA